MLLIVIELEGRDVEAGGNVYTYKYNVFMYILYSKLA